MGTFVDKMKQDMRRPEIFRQTCAAHKLELILETPLKRGLCDNCQKLDAILKKISAFYARSPKRTNSLRKFCKTNHKIFFRPRKILDIRWVSSHFYAGRHIFFLMPLDVFSNTVFLSVSPHMISNSFVSLRSFAD